MIFPLLSEDLTLVRAGKLSKVYVTLPQITRTPNQLFLPFLRILVIHLSSSSALFSSLFFSIPFPHSVICHVVSNARRLRFAEALYSLAQATSQRSSDERRGGAQKGHAGAVRDAMWTCHRDVSTAITGVAHAISATNTLGILARTRKNKASSRTCNFKESIPGPSKGRVESQPHRTDLDKEKPPNSQ